MGVELRERWGRQPVWARWAFAVYLIGFLVGTRTHVLDVARDGVHAYAMFPQVPLQVFFVSLVVLDPLVILLVGLAWREGIWLAGAVMVQVFDRDTGMATVTDPQGNTERVDLHDLNSRGGAGASDVLDGLGDLGSLGGLNDTGGGDGTTPRDVSLSDLGLGGGVSSGSSGGGLSGESYLSPDGSGGVGAEPLSDGAADSTGTPLLPAATAGAPGAPGMPGSPGMPMGGMGAGGAGGAGAGGERGNGERVRAVLVDAVEESERRNRRRRSPWNRQEEDDTFLARASRVGTTGGDSPEEETEPGRRATSSADYLEEDADVWGTEEGGTPAVIGR